MKRASNLRRAVLALALVVLLAYRPEWPVWGKCLVPAPAAAGAATRGGIGSVGRGVWRARSDNAPKPPDASGGDDGGSGCAHC